MYLGRLGPEGCDPHVRFGSLADILLCGSDVSLPPKTDIHGGDRNVRFAPRGGHGRYRAAFCIVSQCSNAVSTARKCPCSL